MNMNKPRTVLQVISRNGRNLLRTQVAVVAIWVGSRHPDDHNIIWVGSRHPDMYNHDIIWISSRHPDDQNIIWVVPRDPDIDDQNIICPGHPDVWNNLSPFQTPWWSFINILTILIRIMMMADHESWSMKIAFDHLGRSQRPWCKN